ncbi:hypothetical protein DL769_003585 [Monosporascus sp. CRB-8-3]|nr:hypothetical protein DL769_003585 [Monosporascus sp. CRB-8-3]
MELPFLNLHGKDAFEDSRSMPDKMNGLSQLVTMTNLKARLLVDVKGLKDHVANHPNLSYEERMEWVRGEAQSDILYALREIVEQDDFQDLVQDLSSQVAKLYRRVEQLNNIYWPGLDHPERYGTALPLCILRVFWRDDSRLQDPPRECDTTSAPPSVTLFGCRLLSYMVTVRVSAPPWHCAWRWIARLPIRLRKAILLLTVQAPEGDATAQGGGVQKIPAAQEDSVLYDFCSLP